MFKEGDVRHPLNKTAYESCMVCSRNFPVLLASGGVAGNAKDRVPVPQ